MSKDVKITSNVGSQNSPVFVSLAGEHSAVSPSIFQYCCRYWGSACSAGGCHSKYTAIWWSQLIKVGQSSLCPQHSPGECFWWREDWCLTGEGLWPPASCWGCGPRRRWPARSRGAGASCPGLATGERGVVRPGHNELWEIPLVCGIWWGAKFGPNEWKYVRKLWTLQWKGSRSGQLFS